MSEAVVVAYLVGLVVVLPVALVRAGMWLAVNPWDFSEHPDPWGERYAWRWWAARIASVVTGVTILWPIVPFVFAGWWLVSLGRRSGSRPDRQEDDPLLREARREVESWERRS